jgi:hypothetical protein
VRKLFIAASIAAIAIPCAAMAQPGCVSDQEAGHTAAGTAAGAGTGALVGAAVGGPVGAVAGAIGGAAVGASAGASAPVYCNGYTATGYYDSYGVWHPDVAYGPPPAAPQYGADVAYAGRGDLNMREDRLDRRINDGWSSGAISGSQVEYDRDQLSRIRDMQANMAADNGGLTQYDFDRVSRRLDDLDATVRGQEGY